MGNCCGTEAGSKEHVYIFRFFSTTKNIAKNFISEYLVILFWPRTDQFWQSFRRGFHSDEVSLEVLFQINANFARVLEIEVWDRSAVLGRLFLVWSKVTVVLILFSKSSNLFLILWLLWMTHYDFESLETLFQIKIMRRSSLYMKSFFDWTVGSWI